MTNPNYTAVALLIDRSGSMSSIEEATEDAINEFIQGQAAADGKRTVRLSVFDHAFTTLYKSTPAADCPKFHLSPRGTTALLDSIVKAARLFGEELRDMPEDERPGHVIFAIMTDGLENASIHNTYEMVAETLTHQQEKYGWEVLFLGANQDAIATGAKLGIRSQSSITYSASTVGTHSVINTMNDYVAVAAAGLPTANVIDDEAREAALQSD